MDSPYTLISKDCKGMDVSVTFTDANHCPGAAVLYFSIGNPKRPKAPKRRILHVGDFRWNSNLFLQNAVYSRIHEGAVRLNEIYLDTTYCDPKYDFPSQDDAVAAALECVEKEVRPRIDRRSAAPRSSNPGYARRYGRRRISPGQTPSSSSALTPLARKRCSWK